MISSDEESLAGLTQVPSQKPAKRRKLEETFKLKKASELAFCSANQESDFENHVANLMHYSSSSDEDNSEASDIHEQSTELFSQDTANSHGQGVGIDGKNAEVQLECSTEPCTTGNGGESVERDVPYSVETEDISDEELVSLTEAAEKQHGGSLLSPLPLTEAQKNRFKAPRTEVEMTELGKQKMADATMSKMNWALRAYRRWIDYRRHLFFGWNTFTATRMNRYIHDLHESVKSEAMLSNDICDFICEVKKENGQEYPPSTIYDLVFMLSLYLEREFGIKCLTTLAWPKIHRTLDGVMKEQTAKGLGVQKNRDDITENVEEKLWQDDFLGHDNPEKLCLTLMYLLGVHFGLRGGVKHRGLIRFPRSQLCIELREGKDCLVYTEFKSKMNQGGIRERNVKKPRVVYAFRNSNPDRCVVELYNKYVSLCPRPNESCTAFYLQTNPSWSLGDLWYVARPIGKNKLSDYIKKLMQRAGVQGIFSNHSLRATTCSRLFDHLVDEQLICEQTGHSGNSVRRYKHSTLEMKEKVSSILGCDQKSGAVSKSFHGIGVKSSCKVGQTSTSKTAESSGEKHLTVQSGEPQNLHVNLPAEAANYSGLVNIHFHFK